MRARPSRCPANWQGAGGSADRRIGEELAGVGGMQDGVPPDRSGRGGHDAGEGDQKPAWPGEQGQRDAGHEGRRGGPVQDRSQLSMGRSLLGGAVRAGVAGAGQGRQRRLRRAGVPDEPVRPSLPAMCPVKSPAALWRRRALPRDHCVRGIPMTPIAIGTCTRSSPAPASRRSHGAGWTRTSERAVHIVRASGRAGIGCRRNATTRHEMTSHVGRPLGGDACGRRTPALDRLVEGMWRCRPPRVATST